MQEVLSTRVIAAALGLSAFAIALLAGLAVDNPAPDILTRALIALVACSFLGMLIGLVAERIVADHLKQTAGPEPVHPTVAPQPDPTQPPAQ